MTDDSLIVLWTGWLDDLRRDLYFIHHHREMWSAVSQAMSSRAPDTPSTWLNHYQRLYVDGQTMAVRRLIRHKGSMADNVSLRRLMDSLIVNQGILTLDRHLERWRIRAGTDQLDRARRDYEADWSDGTGNLRTARIRQDIAELNQIADGVIEVADRSVAHTVEGRPHLPLTFGELDLAIDHVARVYQDYAVLVTGSYYALTPVVQDNWESSFYRPLFDAPDWWPQEAESD